MPISALPSKSGIGNFGEGAYRFVDALSSAGVEFWQILPLNIQGKGNSPYSSPSAFAISPLYLDYESKEIPNTGKINYRQVMRKTETAVKKITEDFDFSNPDYLLFLKQNAFWLDDFGVFMKGDESSHKAIQYTLRRQWNALKSYANEKNVKIIGDMPIYVSAESADVVGNPSLFAVGNDFTPLVVAGVPPDLFSSDGQLWGNPVYNWTANRNTGFSWWINRLKYSLSLYDFLRIDHFRAFSSYYAIPYGSKTAKTGIWEYAPGKELFSRFNTEVPNANIIAEDLGLPTPDVAELLAFTGFPGMKILQFSFSGSKSNPFRRENHPANSVCYTGTHDNDTTLGWYSSATDHERKSFERLVPKNSSLSPAHRLILYGDESESQLFIVPICDFLELSSNARINIPSTEKGNWEWRMSDSQLESLPEIIKKLLSRSDRLRPTE